MADFENLYLLVFCSAAIALVLLERVPALQRQTVQIARRWTSNIGLFLIGNVINAVVIPIGIFAFAQQQPPGPFSRLDLPFAVQLLLTFCLLDLWRYAEHRLFHRVSLLWRLHLVHHSDTHIDVTTSERHHPLEVLLGTAVLMAVIAALGLPAPAVGVYLLTATAIALCSHANLRLPASLDRQLSRLIVTPAVHAVHHSDVRRQTDSNYGSVLTLWDRLFGTYVSGVNACIPHFGLEYFHQAKDTGLARVLQQPFLFRRDLAYPARGRGDMEAGRTAIVAGRQTRGAMSRKWKEALVGGAAGSVLVILAMWPTLMEMTALWRMEAYQYAWLVLPMIVYLLGWHRPLADLPVVPRPDFTGIPVVVSAAALWSAASLMNIDVGRQVALVLALQGVVLSTLGWRCYWKLAPTLALMFLMVPSGDLLQPLLRALTLESIELVAATVGLPHSVEGFVVFIGAQRYIVVDECSGLAFVTLGMFLGYSFGLLLYRSMTKVAAVAMSGAFLGVLCNVVRVNVIVLVDWVRGSQMELTAHGGIQWIALFMTLGGVFCILSRLKADEPSATLVAAAPASAIRRQGVAPVIAGLTGLLIAGCAAGLPANEPRLPRGANTGSFPHNIAGWELANPAQAWSVDRQGRTESIDLVYRRDGRSMHAVVVESLSPDAKLPEPRSGFRDTEVWRERQVRDELACAASGCVPVLHSTWQRDKSQQLRHVYHAYSVGSFTTTSKLAFRAAHGWSRLARNGDHPRMIAFVSEEDALDVGEMVAAFAMFQSSAR